MRAFSAIQQQSRNPTIDILRGIAIFTMIAGNLAGEILIEPHPFWFRFYYSFAAALFIIIAGMMVGLTARTKNYKLNYFLIRAIALLITAALVDIFINQIFPFTACDVLYLIGISIPLSYLLSKFNLKARIGIVIAIFALTPVLQQALGYSQLPLNVFLSESHPIRLLNGKEILHNWIIDGWFPLFPWLGLLLSGQIFYDVSQKLKSMNLLDNSWGLLVGASIFVFGAVIWWQNPGNLFSRGYDELFYPPTTGYILTAIGLTLILYFFINLNPFLLIYKPLQVFGQSALFIYIMHLAIIELIIEKIWGEVNFINFLIIYIILTTFLMLFSYLIKLLKSNVRITSFILKFLLGG